MIKEATGQVIFRLPGCFMCKDVGILPLYKSGERRISFTELPKGKTKKQTGNM